MQFSAAMFRIIFIIFSLMTLSNFTLANQLEEAKVDYTGDFSFDTEAMKMNGKVFSTKKKERREMSGMTIITRKDKGVRWQLMPGNMYTESDLNAEKNEAPNEGKILEKSEVGKETIDGHECTKYKMIMEQKDGKKFGGFFWITKENIPLKSDMLFKEGEKKHRMITELKNLKIGPVDNKLFELPAGYSKFSMGGMPFGGQGMMGGQGAGGAKAPKGNTQAPQGGMPQGMPNMQEMMKKMQEQMKKAQEGAGE